MKYSKGDFFMVVMLVFVLFVSLFVILKPTKIVSMASEQEVGQY